MNPKPLPRLDTAIFHRSLTLKESPTEGAVQVLLPPSESSEPRKFILISTGLIMRYVFLAPDVVAKVEKLKSFDIISARLNLPSPEEDPIRLQLTSFELLASDVDSIIGSPTQVLAGAGAPSLRLEPPKAREKFPEVGEPREYAVVERRGTVEQLSDNEILPKSEETKDSHGDHGDSFHLSRRDSSDGSDFTRISELNHGNSSFQLKARVVNKEPLRPLKRGEGSTFAIRIRDRSGSIRCIFTRALAGKFHATIREGSVYTFSGGRVELAPNGSVFALQVNFNDSANILAQPDDPSLPNTDKNFVRLANLPCLKLNAVVDVLAAMLDHGTTADIALKNGGTKRIKKMRVVDADDVPVEVCVWGERADSLQPIPGRLYHFREVKVKEFRGVRNLLMEEYSEMLEAFKETGESEALAAWVSRNPRRFETAPPQEEPRASSSAAEGPPPAYWTLHGLRNDATKFFESEENQSKRRYYHAVVHLMGISKKLFYLSCGLRDCRKKVTEVNGQILCEKCNREVSSPVKRFMSDVALSDASGLMFFRAFSEEICQQLLDVPESRLDEVDPSNEEEFNKFIKKNYFKEYSVRLMLRRDFFDENMRVSAEVVRVEPFEKSESITKVSRSVYSLLIK